MNHKSPAVLLFIASLVLGCSKSETLNVTSIVYRDSSNTPEGSSGNTSGQWVEQSFSLQEMALFNDLTTVSLEGTSTPTSVNQLTAYPNPFINYTIIHPGFNQGFQGQVVAKYVVVNSFFQTVAKGSTRIDMNSQQMLIGSAIPKGYYRVYVTYSAAANEHFFKFWGNVLKN